MPILFELLMMANYMEGPQSRLSQISICSHDFFCYKYISFETKHSQGPLLLRLNGTIYNVNILRKRQSYKFSVKSTQAIKPHMV